MFWYGCLLFWICCLLEKFDLNERFIEVEFFVLFGYGEGLEIGLLFLFFEKFV